MRKTTNEVWQGDCLKLMENIPDGSVDMILCDLPYGNTDNKWDVPIDTKQLWGQYRRVIKENGAIVLTATNPFASELIASNKTMYRYDLIWHKPMAVGFLNAKKMPMRAHELILVFYKKLPTYNPQFFAGKPYKRTQYGKSENYLSCKYKPGIETKSDGRRYPRSVLEISRDKNSLHPTQKPLELFVWLVKTYTNSGQLVLDNCLGVGTTAIACLQTGRRFLGMEIEKKYIDMANSRIEREIKSWTYQAD